MDIADRQTPAESESESEAEAGAEPGAEPVALASAAASVAARAGLLADSLESGSPDEAAVARRLRACVVRPLGEASTSVADGHGAIDLDGGVGLGGDGLGTVLEDLALALAAAIDRERPQAYALEALASLMELASRAKIAGSEAEVEQRRTRLAAAVADLPRAVLVRDDGPYLSVNVADLRDTLGLTMPAAAVVALCRCGASATKPLCDGSHESIGFHPVKDPDWGPNRRRHYPGPTSVIGDNRAMCARSELCSSRLSAVFHQDGRPFVTPGAGRLDEIVRAVLECPSGALTLTMNGHEVRNEERDGAAGGGGRIAVTRDGPYRVTGDAPLVDERWRPIARGDGAPADRFSLCRCGATRNTPLCSGQHHVVHFTDPLPDRDRLPSLFEWAGGMPAFERLMRRFYQTYVPADPLLAPLFGTMPPDHPERVAAWLAEVFGAPDVYSVPYGGFPRMMSRHLGGNFNEAQRARFVELIIRAADDVGLPADPEFRAAFVAYYEWGSRIAVETSRPGAKPPPAMQMPRWQWIRDAVPGARPPSFARHEQRPELVVPAPGETVRFAVHIRPQFRKMDRLAMMYAFDLWNAASVREKAQGILARMRDGTMPVDGPWPQEAIDLFVRWIDEGMSD